MRPSSTGFAPLSAIIFVFAIIVLGISVAETVLEQNVLHAFRNVKIQYPGSSLAEWFWVPMKPSNIDSGPTTAITVAGAVGITAAVVTFAWVNILWWGVTLRVAKICGKIACAVAVLNAATSLAVTTYVFVVHAAQNVPEFYRDWHTVQFDREIYLCEAFPRLVPDAQALYGFPACNHVKAARLCLIALALISTALAGFGVLHLVLIQRQERKGIQKGDV